MNLEYHISIIIPCFNDGKFLKEAIESILVYNGKYKVEIIIVNDGSTDSFTLEEFKRLEVNGFQVIHQENKGLSAARNTGIEHAKAPYILPLDSDNKILPDYIGLSIEHLLNDPKKIIYSNRQHFGDVNSLYIPPDFSIRRMMVQNTIDACAVFSKNMWKELGGYDENMKKGYEDWEFWIRAYKAGYSFLKLNRTCFMYRVRKDSMVQQTKKNETHQLVLSYIQKKHFELFSQQYLELFEENQHIKTSLTIPVKIWLNSLKRRILKLH